MALCRRGKNQIAVMVVCDVLPVGLGEESNVPPILTNRLLL